jgi:hypothetical protein
LPKRDGNATANSYQDTNSDTGWADADFDTALDWHWT